MFLVSGWQGEGLKTLLLGVQEPIGLWYTLLRNQLTKEIPLLKPMRSLSTHVEGKIQLGNP